MNKDKAFNGVKKLTFIMHVCSQKIKETKLNITQNESSFNTCANVKLVIDPKLTKHQWPLNQETILGSVAGSATLCLEFFLKILVNNLKQPAKALAP